MCDAQPVNLFNPDRVTKKVYVVMRHTPNPADDQAPNVDLIDVRFTRQSATDLAATVLHGFVVKVFASK